MRRHKLLLIFLLAPALAFAEANTAVPSIEGYWDPETGGTF